MINDKENRDISRLSYTSRDYMSIFEDLVNSIPVLTDLWTTKDESDPGIVLVKLMSMLGDMLSYNQDKQALEVYPGTVTQRKNAAQIYGLIGYKMHWYRSARCTVLLSNSSASEIKIPRYTRFRTSDGNLYYTNLDEITLLASEIGNQPEKPLVQGLPVTPQKLRDYLTIEDQYWHSIYGYNLYSRDIINNEYFLNDSNVDETTIVLVDDSDEEWKQVDNLELQTSTGKFFELRIDEYDRPYIKFVKYWEKYNANQFKLFYILSDGKKGEVSYGMLNNLATNVYSSDMGDGYQNKVIVANNNVSISNYASTNGYDPESPDEARVSSASYVNTYDTLVTLDDFTRATKRVAEVANAIALDLTCDPNLHIEKYEKDGKIQDDSYIVNIYVARRTEYELEDKESFRNELDTYLRDLKMMPLDLRYFIEEEWVTKGEGTETYRENIGINMYYWTVEGNVYLEEPVDVDRARKLLLDINNQLKYEYGPSKVDFNSDIRYIDVVNTITNTDQIIHYVELEQIKYYKYTDDPNREDASPNEFIEVTNKDEVSGNVSNTFEASSVATNENGSFTIRIDNIYKNNEDNNPKIKPGSVVIRINNGSIILRDNGNGSIVGYEGVINTEKNPSTIDYYNNGELTFTLTAAEPVGDIVIDFKMNIISMPRYMNLSTNTFKIASESLKI